MRYYLSSYKLGNKTEKLKELIRHTSGKFGYIPNALDFTTADPERRKAHIERDMNEFREVGTEIESLDLRDYFDKKEALKTKLSTLGGLYVSGGNCFVLRQAMKLSELDTCILEMQERNDFLYAGYSAGGCVMGPSLKVHAITDDATDFPYPQISETVWEGLGILNFTFEPHYASEHAESASTDREIKYCVDNKILFRAYKDGEVLILE